MIWFGFWVRIDPADDRWAITVCAGSCRLRLLLADPGDDFPGTVAPLIHLASTRESLYWIGAPFSFRAAPQVGLTFICDFFLQNAIAIRAAKLSRSKEAVETLADKNYSILDRLAEHERPRGRKIKPTL
jgi:hypothetical protein